MRKIHFIGLGGISMSALAKLMLLKGNKVTGSDLKYTDEFMTAVQWGAEAWIGHCPEKMADSNLVVYSSAVPNDDIELDYARQNGIRVCCRNEFLGELSKEYERVIAVSGTHGKTTATGMIANIFLKAGLAFTAHIGGNITGLGNIIYKGCECLVTEACEYKKSLLRLNPDIAVVLNVEADHPDSYPGGVSELYETFDKFISGIKKGGSLVIFADMQYYYMKGCTSADISAYGETVSGDARITDICEYGNGCFGYQISYKGQPKVSIRLSIPGYHNIYNSAAAFLACRAYGIADGDITEGLFEFKGVERRFEKRGECRGANVFIDYAHHPSEIKAAIKTAESFKKGKIITVFQPHTYSRTRLLFDGFMESLALSDSVYIFKEYAAREECSAGASAYDLYEAMKENGADVYYYDSTLILAKSLTNVLEKGDILLILGAGDINGLAELLVDMKF